MKNQGYVNSKGTNIFYQIRGTGDPLVLLMGFGADGNVWEQHAAVYEQHFQCIILDNRGVGLSDQPKGPYTTQMMAGDTIAVMDHLGIQQAKVAGISMGGAIAQEVALNYPDRVSCLALISTWPIFNNYAKTVYENLKKLRVTSKPDDFMELLQLWIFAPPYYEEGMADLKEGQQGAAENPTPQTQNGFEGQLDACIHHDTVSRLHQIKVPTLITIGQMDIFTPPAFSDILHEKIPGSVLVNFPTGGHVHHWEDLERFNQVTTDFLKASTIDKKRVASSAAAAAAVATGAAISATQTNIQLACETYTWQMPGEQYKGKLEHIMDICEKAGFAGIEPETSFMQHLEDPHLMKAALDRYNLQLPVLCVVEDWLHPKETPEELERAAKWMAFLKQFPDTILLLVQMPGKDRSNLVERQSNMITCVNDFARRASEQGIVCSYHPNSPSGSVFRTEGDYGVLLNGLDEQAIGYCPDVGHIAKGGMDPAAIIQQYRSRVNLVHYKDMFADGRWAATGEGIIDFKGITQDLIDTGYQGWIIMEDECDACITQPDEVTLADGEWINRVMRPML